MFYGMLPLGFPGWGNLSPGASTAVNFCKEDIIYLWWNPGWNSFLIMLQTIERAQKRNRSCRKNPSKQRGGWDSSQAWKRADQNQHKSLASPFVGTKKKKPVWVSGVCYGHRNLVLSMDESGQPWLLAGISLVMLSGWVWMWALPVLSRVGYYCLNQSLYEVQGKFQRFFQNQSIG